jgi:signal peptidase I
MDGVDIVKRVIGIAGDEIEVKSDQVFRNGEPLPRIDRGPCTTGTGARQGRCHVYESKVGDRTFLISAARPAYDPMPTHVPAGHIYVLGDHRDSSNDSRNPAVGAIPVTRVKGKALSIYWSTGEDGLRTARMFSSVQ